MSWVNYRLIEGACGGAPKFEGKFTIFRRGDLPVRLL